MTARPRPDAAAMLVEAVELENGLYVFSPTDMVIHSAAHLFADGEMDGGLRNLWDIRCLLSEFGNDEIWPSLQLRAQHHQLWTAVLRAARLAHQLYGTDIPENWRDRNWQDGFYIKRLIARERWGRSTRKPLRLAFYIRSHWLRMPPLMLARHLWVKWWKQ